MPGSVRIFGIPNCDTVKRARAWLAEHGVDAAFVDFKKVGVPVDAAARWSAALGWQALLNTRGTTWRKLDEATRDAVVDAASALQVMRAHPSTVRRPVVEWPDGRVSAGFDAGDFAERSAR